MTLVATSVIAAIAWAMQANNRAAHNERDIAENRTCIRYIERMLREQREDLKHVRRLVEEMHGSK